MLIEQQRYNNEQFSNTITELMGSPSWRTVLKGGENGKILSCQLSHFSLLTDSRCLEPNIIPLYLESAKVLVSQLLESA